MSPLPLSHLPPLIPLPIFLSSSALPFPLSSPLSSIPELPSPSPLYHHNSLLLPLRHPLCMDQRGSQYSEDQGYGLRVKSETENYLSERIRGNTGCNYRQFREYALFIPLCSVSPFSIEKHEYLPLQNKWFNKQTISDLRPELFMFVCVGAVDEKMILEKMLIVRRTKTHPSIIVVMAPIWLLMLGELFVKPSQKLSQALNSYIKFLKNKSWLMCHNSSSDLL